MVFAESTFSTDGPLCCFQQKTVPQLQAKIVSEMRCQSIKAKICPKFEVQQSILPFIFMPRVKKLMLVRRRVRGTLRKLFELITPTTAVNKGCVPKHACQGKTFPAVKWVDAVILWLLSTISLGLSVVLVVPFKTNYSPGQRHKCLVYDPGIRWVKHRQCYWPDKLFVNFSEAPGMTVIFCEQLHTDAKCSSCHCTNVELQKLICRASHLIWTAHLLNFLDSAHQHGCLSYRMGKNMS